MANQSEYYKKSPLLREVINFQDYVEKNAKYISPSVEGLPLFASSILPDAQSINASAYNGVLNSGLNVGLFGSSFPAIYYALKGLRDKTRDNNDYSGPAVEQTANNHFNLLVSNPDLHNNIYLNYFLVRLKDFPNFGGWDFSDEPKFYNLKKLVKPYSLLKQGTLDKTLFSNLWGWQVDREPPKEEEKKNTSTATEDLKETTSADNSKVNVQEYIQEFQKLFHPGVWSYDMYPIGFTFTKNDKNSESEETYEKLKDYISTKDDYAKNWFAQFMYPIEDDAKAGKPTFEKRINLYRRLTECPGKLNTNNCVFYWNLELYSRMSYITGRPFYAYCDTMTYWNVKDNYMRPRPTIDFLRFEAFSPLAYGAQGICFWTYCMRSQNKIWTPEDDKNCTAEVLLTAMADVNGKIERLSDVALTEEQKKNLAPDTYDVVSDLIKEIKKYEFVFEGASLVDAVHLFGNDDTALSANVIPGLKIADHLGAIKKISVNSSQHNTTINGLEVNYDDDNGESDGNFKRNHLNGVLITQLMNKGRNFMVIVNHDPFNSKELSITLAASGIYELTPISGFTTEDYLNWESMVLNVSFYEKTVNIIRTIPAGGYLIYEFE